VYPQLRTPGQVSLGVVIVFGIGSMTAVVVSLILAAAIPSVVGDGTWVVRLSFVAFAVAPCISLGTRCARWWAFTGAAALVPLLGFAVLVAGPGSHAGGLAFAAEAVLATAFALAVGSLQSALAARDAFATSSSAGERAVDTPGRQLDRPLHRQRRDLRASVSDDRPRSSDRAEGL
jgi:hypothetical protein